MARINIEDSLLRDGRFFELASKLGCRETAVGALYFAWDLAQKWWRTHQKLIPENEWFRLKFGQAILDVGLAEVRDAGLVYVCGSEEQFLWLEQKIQAGRNGGLAKARSAKRTLAPAKRRLPSSSPSPSSSTTKTNTYAQQVERAYLGYPRKVGKTKGIKRLAREIKSEQDLADLEKSIQNYAAAVIGSEPQFIKHFSTFAGEWRDWINPPAIPAEVPWAPKEEREGAA